MRGARRGGLPRYVCCLDGMRGRVEGWGRDAEKREARWGKSNDAENTADGEITGTGGKGEGSGEGEDRQGAAEGEAEDGGGAVGAGEPGGEAEEGC